MKLVEASVAQPITVAVGVLLALLAGFIAVTRVPVQMTPEVESVVISVTTTWEGAAAQEVETDVVEAQEERLGNLSGLQQIKSVSQPGQGQIILEFDTGVDIDAARTEVDLKLAEVPATRRASTSPL
ncbi:MAG: efflux RND transporter permease subunit [Planctomycetota bacterium]